MKPMITDAVIARARLANGSRPGARRADAGVRRHRAAALKLNPRPASPADRFAHLKRTYD